MPILDSDAAGQFGMDGVLLALEVGVRFPALQSQRIDPRLDHARGEREDTPYLSVIEAFCFHAGRG